MKHKTAVSILLSGTLTLFVALAPHQSPHTVFAQEEVPEFKGKIEKSYEDPRNGGHPRNAHPKARRT